MTGRPSLPSRPHKSKAPRAKTRQSREAALRRALLIWFRRSGRPLPWRGARSPYAVWVAEIMLQQTQVDTVIPYYQRFLQRFPDVRHLAAAPLDRVLELWSGLGYYRRARLMHHAAQEMMARFGGQFPPDYAAARSLPGVGNYTARAVLSIAYNLPFTVLDGNVARVIARLRARKGNIHEKSFRGAVEHDLQGILSRRRPGDFNQALMQIGQLICLPRMPRCTECPLRADCASFSLGVPEDFPEPRPRRTAEPHFMASAVLRQGNKVALVRGLDGGLLSDLWNFPSAFGPSEKASRKTLRDRLARSPLCATLPGKPHARLTHQITHRRIQVSVYVTALGHLPGKTTKVLRREPNGNANDVKHMGMRWISIASLRNSAISRLCEKISGAILT